MPGFPSVDTIAKAVASQLGDIPDQVWKELKDSDWSSSKLPDAVALKIQGSLIDVGDGVGDAAKRLPNLAAIKRALGKDFVLDTLANLSGKGKDSINGFFGLVPESFDEFKRCWDAVWLRFPEASVFEQYCKLFWDNLPPPPTPEALAARLKDIRDLPSNLPRLAIAAPWALTNECVTHGAAALRSLIRPPNVPAAPPLAPVDPAEAVRQISEAVAAMQRQLTLQGLQVTGGEVATELVLKAGDAPGAHATFKITIAPRP